MGNFLTIFERSEEIVEPQQDTSITLVDETLDNKNEISDNKNEIFDFNFELLNEENTLEVSEKISEKMLKEIFEEIKKRNPVIIEEDIEPTEYNQVKTISNLENGKVETIINSLDKETCIESNNEPVTTTIKTTTFDKNVLTEIKTEVGSNIKYQNSIPKFYPNVTSIPYKFPPYPAPSNVYKQNSLIVNRKSKPTFSFWGNAYMDTKRLNNQQQFKAPPTLQYSPYALNSGIAFKYKKE